MIDLKEALDDFPHSSFWKIVSRNKLIPSTIDICESIFKTCSNERQTPLAKIEIERIVKSSYKRLVKETAPGIGYIDCRNKNNDFHLITGFANYESLVGLLEKSLDSLFYSAATRKVELTDFTESRLMIYNFTLGDSVDLPLIASTLSVQQLINLTDGI